MFFYFKCIDLFSKNFKQKYVCFQIGGGEDGWSLLQCEGVIWLFMLNEISVIVA